MFLHLLLAFLERRLDTLEFLLQSFQPHGELHEGLVIRVHDVRNRSIALGDELRQISLQLVQLTRRRVLGKKLFRIELLDEEIALSKGEHFLFHGLGHGLALYNGFHAGTDGRVYFCSTCVQPNNANLHNTKLVITLRTSYHEDAHPCAE